VHKILITLFLALAIFHGVPRLSCACDALVVASPSQMHSCCEKEVKSDCCSAGVKISKPKSCCGMMSPAVPGLANSLSLLPDYNPDLLAISFSKSSDLLASAHIADPLARLNRAPPWQKGIGSSKTYLYKRVFLI